MVRKSIIVVAIAVLAIFTGCSKYKPVGPPEFYVNIQCKRESTISPGKSVTTYTVTALTINQQPIELTQPVSSSESRFEVETKRYGTIQFRVEGSGRTSILNLYLTKEQQESIGAMYSPVEEIKSIAVLPLENLSGDPKQEWFADKNTEALIYWLVNIGAFDKVAPFTSVITLRGSDDLSKIARDLDVDVVLEGGVQLIESKVRLSVQLIYVPANRHMWTESYERELEELPDLVRDVATKVSDIASLPARIERD